MNCTELVKLASIAENYGQMTGVLAGFAFTGLVILLTPNTSDHARSVSTRGSGVPLALFVSFISLVLTTLLYSVMAGDSSEVARPRAATVELINGLVFALAVIILLHGVGLLMQGARIERSAVSFARFSTVVAFPTMGMFFIAQGVSDTAAARAMVQGQDCQTTMPPLGMWLTAVEAAVLSASLTGPVRRKLSSFSGVGRLWAPLVVFIVSIIVTMVSAFISTRSPRFLMSPTAINWFLVGSALLFTALGLMLCASSKPDSPPTRVMPDFPRRRQLRNKKPAFAQRRSAQRDLVGRSRRMPSGHI
ncbi:hypothetical protein [Actinoplanes sp. NPDC049265]|uniref:hypothetical protein n=1 Tax=Actinoplanes sp. NPDC049265 TaxID=3363902 RepID=UPI003724A050